MSQKKPTTKEARKIFGRMIGNLDQLEGRLANFLVENHNDLSRFQDYFLELMERGEKENDQFAHFLPLFAGYGLGIITKKMYDSITEEEKDV